MFHTVGRMRSGYHVGEVDEYFTRARQIYEGRSQEQLTAAEIRTAAFGLVRGGYNPAAVDAALDRLERAFAARQRAEYVGLYGEQAWMTALQERAKTLYGRLTRPAGQRFAPAQRGEPAYDRAEVDALCKRLIAYFDSGAPLRADDVRAMVFTRRRGAGGYAEGPVDAFLDRAVEVLLGVE